MKDYEKKYSRDKEFMDAIEKTPYIKFPSDWYVKPIGPFTGAITRFLVTKDPTESKGRVSVYADFYNRLGFYGNNEPHWEVYPDIDGDNARCSISDADTLIELIEGGLEFLENK